MYVPGEEFSQMAPLGSGYFGYRFGASERRRRKLARPGAASPIGTPHAEDLFP